MRERGVILDPTISVMGHAGEEARSWAVRATRRAHEMGIPIAVGTDSRLLFDEIETLVFDVGLSPVEAIRSATSIGRGARVTRWSDGLHDGHERVHASGFRG